MSATHLEIERKFLVTSNPPGMPSSRPLDIEQGYAIRDGLRELRLRRRGAQYFLTVKEGAGRVREETEIRISKGQFDSLWPLTEGRRLSKVRHVIHLDGYRLELDVFKGGLAPLRLAEIEFPDVASSKAFVKPPFLGEEVTDRTEYRNAELAAHGKPGGSRVERQIGVVPYVILPDGIHLLLITSSSGNRWIVPKGRSEPEMTPHEVAMMEAVEEAGVVGVIRHDIRTMGHLSDGRIIHLYALKISKLLKSWPEDGQRKRVLRPLASALKEIGDRGLAQGVRKLVSRLT